MPYVSISKNLLPVKLAKSVAKLSQELENKNDSSDRKEIQQASLSIREAVRASETDYSCIVV